MFFRIGPEKRREAEKKAVGIERTHEPLSALFLSLQQCALVVRLLLIFHFFFLEIKPRIGQRQSTGVYFVDWHSPAAAAAAAII